MQIKLIKITLPNLYPIKPNALLAELFRGRNKTLDLLLEEETKGKHTFVCKYVKNYNKIVEDFFNEQELRKLFRKGFQIEVVEICI